MQLAGHDIERWMAVIVGGGTALLTIFKVTKALWRGFWSTAKYVVGEVIEPLDKKVDDLRHYTKYHLGPNDTTKPVFRRIETIEARQMSQHVENKRTLSDVSHTITDHVTSERERISHDATLEAQRRSPEDPPLHP